MKNILTPVQSWFTSTPKCAVFGQCGGCTYQDVSYREELSLKEKTVQDVLGVSKKLYRPTVPSPRVYHYRHRLDLKIINKKDGTSFMGFSPQGDYPFGVVDIDQCPIAMKAINRDLKTIKQKAIKRMQDDKYHRASLVVRTGDLGQVQWGGIGKGSLKRTPEEYLWTEVLGKKIYYTMETFFQANLSILPEVFKYLRSMPLWNENVCFHDLYGGVGLFGIGLADHVGQVVLVEENKISIQCAQFNKKMNKLKNMQIYDGRVEDVWQRLDIAGYAKHIALIDPPRDGLTSEAVQMLSREKRFNDILYLSCNPNALARDIKVFQEKNWQIQSITLFDFFPRTKHIETLVWFSKEDVC